MKVVLASSEVTPFAKTGGLADVCGSLPSALAGLGQAPGAALALARRGDELDLLCQPDADGALQLAVGRWSTDGG